MGNERACDNVHDDVCFTNVDQHVVFQNDWLLLADEDSITNSQVFDEVDGSIDVVLDLEMATAVLLCCLLVFVWDYEVIYDTFLRKIERVRMVRMYLRSLFALDQDCSNAA